MPKPPHQPGKKLEARKPFKIAEHLTISHNKREVVKLLNEFMDLHNLSFDPLKSGAIKYALAEKKLTQRDLEQFAMILKLYRMTP